MKNTSGYWADHYQQNRRPVGEAIARIESGQRAFIWSSCGDPHHLVQGPADARQGFLETRPILIDKSHIID